MRLFNLSEQVTKEIREKAGPKFTLRLTDIFSNYQDHKIEFNHAKAQISSRINSFIKKEDLKDSTIDSLTTILGKIKQEEDPLKVDDLINSIYTVADANDILIK